LTGLSNRALFMDRLGRLVSRVRRHSDYLFAVIWLDIDRFKVVNDSLGHLIGDELLIQMGHRLEECLRASDTVARIGGDEFTILLDDIASTSDAIRVAERIHEALSEPFELNDQEIYTSASMGIALSAPEYERPEEIMRDADTAMYRAKALGKACHVVFDGSMHARAVALLELETSLRRAVERQEFRVHYQPIVSLDSEELIGFEALVRWQHPERGLVFPGDFISVAEDTGLVLPIGRWVLKAACRQLREWQARFPSAAPLWVSVNLSSKQLAQPDIAEQIRQVLEETGLPGRSLKLEITESMLMESIDSAATILEQLRALDIQVSVDDFGTGYSCLSYLHRLPLDTLKVDRSFVAGLGLDDERSAIVRTVITLAHNLGMQVVAEGVETREQVDLLSALGCRYGQGYLFSKPVDGEKAEQLIAAEAHAWAV
jgi:diguanylate cyclase (GGDEF)-like protein